MELDARIPSGPIETRWDTHRFNVKLVNPANKRKYTVIVVGTGLAGGSAAASLAELGYNVKCLLLSGFAAARAQHRGAGRHQRRQELPQRRRQHLPPLLRHGEGRRLPRPARRTSTGWRRSASTSSTSAWRRACPSRANTAATSTTAPSAARRCPAPSTPAARRASSFCWAATRRWSGRSGWARSRCTRAPRCWTWWWSTARRAAS